MKKIPLRTKLLGKAFINRETGCWEWRGAKCHQGYGQLTLGKQSFRAHRLAYEMFVGPIPAGLQLDHLCRVQGPKACGRARAGRGDAERPGGVMGRDYANIPVAIRNETLETLRQSVEVATANAENHRISAKHHQEIADREAHYAARDEERARQWQAQLDFVEQVMRDAEAADDAMSASERFEHDQDAEARLDAVAGVWSDLMVDDGEGGE